MRRGDDPASQVAADSTSLSLHVYFVRNEEEVTAERVAYGLGLEMHTVRLPVADVPHEREQAYGHKQEGRELRIAHHSLEWNFIHLALP